MHATQLLHFLAVAMVGALVTNGIITSAESGTVTGLIESGLVSLFGLVMYFTNKGKAKQNQAVLTHAVNKDAGYEVPKTFGGKSDTLLEQVHPDLKRLMLYALNSKPPYDFFITHGVRTLEEQKKHVASGASKTMDSDHLYGLAVDIGVYTHDRKYDQSTPPYLKMRPHIEACAKELGLEVQPMIAWDSGHYALPRRLRGWDK